LDGVFALGGNTFDTAHVYGIGGASERGLGRWMRERGNREKVVIIGKGGIRSSPPAPFKTMTSFIDADIWESLARLQTDYMDLYLLHYDDDRHPVGPYVETLHAHLEAGRIHAYGGSNWSHARIQEANDYAAAHGLAPFVASQPQYSLVEAKWPGRVSIGGPSNREARAWYAANGIAVIPYQSLGAGFMSGRVSRENYERANPTSSGTFVKAYCREENFQRLDRATELAQEKDVTVAQITLAFMIQGDMTVLPLTGARTADEFADSAGALDIVVTPEERAWLDLESNTR
jgi:aryl-alcohol dehydrogenase-like predicted oxidoreductase